jgi:hypothetical protein
MFSRSDNEVGSADLQSRAMHFELNRSSANRSHETRWQLVARHAKLSAVVESNPTRWVLAHEAGK